MAWFTTLALDELPPARSDGQADVVFLLMAMFIFSALGGTWFSLEASSGAFAAVGKLLPSAWR